MRPSALAVEWNGLPDTETTLRTCSARLERCSEAELEMRKRRGGVRNGAGTSMQFVVQLQVWAILNRSSEVKAFFPVSALALLGEAVRERRCRGRAAVCPPEILE